MEDCEPCKELKISYDGNPFNPSKWRGRQINPDVYTCQCGQTWWRYNSFYQLWSKVNDQSTIENILAGCQEPVAIGNPSINASKLG